MQTTDTMLSRRFWYGIAVLVGALALFKGIRFPNRYAATQAQIDYSQGFVKRGLFGAVVAGPLHLGNYARFAALSYVLLAALVVLLIVLVRRSGLAARMGGAELLAVFCGSYGVSTMANTVGYFDIPLALLAVCVLMVRTAWLRFAVAVPATVVALLLHEMFLFVFLPVLMLSFVVQGVKEKRRSVMLLALGLAMIAGVAGLRLAYARPMSAARSDVMRLHVAERVNFDVRPDAMDELVLSAADNHRIMKMYFRIFDWYVKQATSVLVFGPSVVLLVLAMLRVLRESKARVWLMVGAVMCALSPLAMHLLAWDVGRFNGLVCLTAFLALIVVVMFTDGPALTMSLKHRRVVGLVLLLSMASGGLLMGRDDKLFPAYPQLKKFKNQMHEMTLAQVANLSD